MYLIYQTFKSLFCPTSLFYCWYLWGNVLFSTPNLSFHIISHPNNLKHSDLILIKLHKQLSLCCSYLLILELTLITPRWLLYHYFQHYPCYISLDFIYPRRWCFSNCHLSSVISSLPNTIQPWSHSYSLLWSFISSYHFLKHHLLHQLNFQHSTVYQNSWNVKLFSNHCTLISKSFTLLIKNLTIAFLNFLLFLTNSPLFLKIHHSF